MRVAVALLALVASAPLARAVDPDPKSLAVPPDAAARAAALVAQLGDRDFVTRDTATKDLRALSRLALPALRDALATSTNAEVRLRIELLLPAAVSADTRARIDCFLADTERKFQHDLPVAKTFFEAAGRSDAAKQLFADTMRSANRDLMLAVDGGAAELDAKYIARRAELGVPVPGKVVAGGVRPDPSGMSAVDVAALLFVETKLPDRAVTGAAAARVLPVMVNVPFQSVLTSALATDRKEALASLVSHWSATREQPLSAYYAITAMNRAQQPHALPAARKLASGAIRGGAVSYRWQAIGYLGRHGTAEDATALEKLFDDKATITTGVGGAGRRHTTQVRDFALAMALVLAKQKPADFGMESIYGKADIPDTARFTYSTFFFDAETPADADKLRDAAFKKYDDWKKDREKK